ncbi:MarR family transcriptional regulator [Haloarcula sp. JP-L23]|uniref:MarR family transcriptional regulator n=1 Tax=Haloarcula sp. JP-L23 TaxID=2716717 RepID=UPI00140F1CF9|nr:MarR family transcriptional regulator [Haloarcula sp. JP-L23]
MPVHFDSYSDQTEGEGPAFDPDTNAYGILTFLGQHDEQGFKPSEIAERTGIKPGSVRGTLKRLEDDGLVRHAEPYWAIGDDDRVAALAGSLLSMQAISDRYADDEFEGWDEEAVDPREMRDE